MWRRRCCGRGAGRALCSGAEELYIGISDRTVRLKIIRETRGYFEKGMECIRQNFSCDKKEMGV